MNIFINGNSLKAFTSGTPQRGLIKAFIDQNAENSYHIQVSPDEESNKLSSFWDELNKYSNVTIEFIKQSQRNINIKKLIGLKKYQKWPSGYDLYLSPGMPENFAGIKAPAISTVADISSIKMPGSSSLKWHGNRIFKNTLDHAIKNNTKIGAISDFTKNELSERYPDYKK
jgi:hypothetical protein